MSTRIHGNIALWISSLSVNSTQVHVCTVLMAKSIRIRRFDCESLRLLQNSFVADKDLRSRNVLLSLKLLLHASSTSF